MVATRALVASTAGLLALGLVTLPPGAEARERRGGAARGVFEFGVRVQAPQRFLERRWFLRGGQIDGRRHAVALRWLAERYGHADDEATMRYNAQPASAHAKTVQFMGMPISVHAKIAPALAAVERRIHKTCTGSSHYTPRAVGGFRTGNTYRGVEVSNHLFGIAVDIDPDRNPCCGCVDPWPTNPICKKPGTVFKRTALPRCWIQSFERFGFDWLGHDTLEDTMHFEFLGDPDRIIR
jgi:hypothetical protein